MIITRGSTAPTMPRGDVSQGLVFAYKKRDGRFGKQYAAVGNNGRSYSVTLANGTLASTSNRDSMATIQGKWKFDVNREYVRGTRVGATMRRSEVKPGEVFVVTGKTEEYAHLGNIDKDHNGWLSVPLARQHNHAVAKNGESTVTVVATYKLSVTLAK